MRTVLIHTWRMDAVAAPTGRVLDPTFVSLAALSPGSTARVVSVGTGGALSALERRLLEFGFVQGEPIEILAEARPGRDPFVVRVGHTTLALRRREVESVWVELHHSATATSPQMQVARAPNGVELHHSATATSPQTQVARAPSGVELHHCATAASPQTQVARVPNGVSLHHSATAASPQTQVARAPNGVSLHHSATATSPQAQFAGPVIGVPLRR
jgi:ferrous iron transport protein A